MIGKASISAWKFQRCVRGRIGTLWSRGLGSALSSHSEPCLCHIIKCQPFGHRQIHRAAQHPVELDQAQADAVEARILLDLRIGAAFTRMQTLSLQTQVRALEEKLVSYGVSKYHQPPSYC